MGEDLLLLFIKIDELRSIRSSILIGDRLKELDLLQNQSKLSQLHL